MSDAAVVKHMLKEIESKLIGGVITDTLYYEEMEGYGFTVNVDGKLFDVFVDCDEEGNGPGWLSISESIEE
jgi:hypothetical protein